MTLWGKSIRRAVPSHVSTQTTAALSTGEAPLIPRGPLRRSTALTRTQATLAPPPVSYSLKDSAYPISHKIVADAYPSLLDLVDNGSLVVHERKPDYRERRHGYREPDRIFLLGTCHLSLKSARDAERLIEAVEPENVVVELCKGRTATLYDQPDDASSDRNPLGLSGGSYAEVMLRTLRLGGFGAFAFRVLMGSLSKRMGRSFQRQSGVEMRAAQKAAERIDSTIVLGDRPIEITLKRAVDALSFGQKMKFLMGLITGLGISDQKFSSEVMSMKDEIEDLSEDLIELWTRRLTDRFPELADPLIHERDLYLAWSMKRSKAVNGSQSVVGIVGRGHLRGTYYALQHDTGTLLFKDLVGRTSPSKNEMLTSFSRRLAVDVAIGVAFYFAWTAVVHSATFETMIAQSSAF